MSRLRMLAAAVVLTLGIVGALPGTWAPSAQAADIEEKIAAAKTPADHEAIAKWYDEQAKEAELKAAEHKKMGDAYKKGGGSLISKTHLDEHCTSLTSIYDREAKEYHELAAAHREMAKTAK